MSEANATVLPSAPAAGRRKLVVRLVRFAKSKPLGMAGAAAVIFVIAVAVCAPLLTPYDPLKLDMPRAFTPPGYQHLLGTDNFGRDVLSRIIWGARVSLSVSLLSVLLGDVIGAVLGLASGYFGGKFDIILQRFFDSLSAFPSLILALTVVAVLGPSLYNVVLAIAV
ncbi:MAG: ABC transporter permease, partial [Chloroflexota bacterium]